MIIYRIQDNVLKIKNPKITHCIGSFYKILHFFFLQILTKMASLRIIPTLLGFLFLFGVHVNANPVANDAPENESSWLKQWMNCFFNDASEDVGHFFLTRLINCWPTTPSM